MYNIPFSYLTFIPYLSLLLSSKFPLCRFPLKEQKNKALVITPFVITFFIITPFVIRETVNEIMKQFIWIFVLCRIMVLRY
jgi:hypothetical protein